MGSYSGRHACSPAQIWYYCLHAFIFILFYFCKSRFKGQSAVTGWMLWHKGARVEISAALQLMGTWQTKKKQVHTHTHTHTSPIWHYPRIFPLHSLGRRRNKEVLHTKQPKKVKMINRLVSALLKFSIHSWWKWKYSSVIWWGLCQRTTLAGPSWPSETDHEPKRPGRSSAPDYIGSSLLWVHKEDEYEESFWRKHGLHGVDAPHLLVKQTFRSCKLVTWFLCSLVIAFYQWVPHTGQVAGYPNICAW